MTVSVSETKSRLFQFPRAHDVPVKFWKFKSNRCDDLMLNGSLYLVAASFHESNLFSISKIARGTTDALAKPSVSCCHVGSRPFLSYANCQVWSRVNVKLSTNCLHRGLSKQSSRWCRTVNNININTFSLDIFLNQSYINQVFQEQNRSESMTRPGSSD